MITLDMNKSVYKLCKENPGLDELLRQLGFTQLSPAMLNTAGRFMTLPKGAKMKGIDFISIVQFLKDNGYEAVNAVTQGENNE